MDEEKVKTKISDWLSEKCDFEIWWAENPPDEYGKFSLEGVADRPDILVSGDSSILLEIKDGKDSSSVYDAMEQLHGYWIEIEFNDRRVTTSNKEFEIDGVAIATQFSKDGHLFKSEREQGYRKTYSDQQSGYNEDIRPQYEYARTEAVPRILWRYAWRYAEKERSIERTEIDTSIGVLLSNEIDTSPEQNSFSSISTPKLLTYDGKRKAYWALLR